MRRKLLFAERLLHGKGDLPFNVLVPVRLKGHIDQLKLTYVLKRLQEKHPLLNAVIENDAAGCPWFVVKQQHIPVIPLEVYERINHSGWQDIVMAELARPFRSREEVLLRLVWLKGAEFSELVLVGHHCLCDGATMLTLLTELLVLLGDSQRTIGVEKPVLRLEDIIPEDILHNRMARLHARLTGNFFAALLRVLPVRRKKIARKEDYLLHWKLNPDLTALLMLKCKLERVTVNTALCLALLRAFRMERKTQFHNKISCPVDIRRFASKIGRDNIFAFGLMLVVKEEQGGQFFSAARRMQLKIDKQTASLKPFRTLMMMEEAHRALESFTRLLKYGKPGNDCMFSNLGKLDIPAVYPDFIVDTVISPVVSGPLGNTTTMLTSTYNGQMDFTFFGSEGYLPKQQAMAIRDQMIRVLSAAALVPGDVS